MIEIHEKNNDEDVYNGIMLEKNDPFEDKNLRIFKKIEDDYTSSYDSEESNSDMDNFDAKFAYDFAKYTAKLDRFSAIFGQSNSQMGFDKFREQADFESEDEDNHLHNMKRIQNKQKMHS